MNLLTENGSSDVGVHTFRGERVLELPIPTLSNLQSNPTSELNEPTGVARTGKRDLLFR